MIVNHSVNQRIHDQINSIFRKVNELLSELSEFNDFDDFTSKNRIA
jgi:hypothetical protein